MGFLNKILYTLDFFPLFPSLQITYRSQDTYSNRASQLTSVLIICLFFTSFYYFGYNMMYRLKPDSVLSEYYQIYPAYLNITKENFFLSFGLKNGQNFVFDETVWIPEFTVKTQTINGTNVISNSTLINISKCENDDLPVDPDIHDYFIRNPVSEMYCIKDYFPIDLEGSFDNPYIKYFNIKIRTCDNLTSKNTCKSQSQIEEVIQNNDFYMSFTSYVVDPMNYSSPFVQRGLYFFAPIDIHVQTSVLLTMQHIEIITDDGIFFEKETVMKALTKLSDRTYISDIANQETLILETNVELDKVVKSYSRKYDKLQDVIAKTGGVLKVLMIVAYFLSRPIVKLGFFQDLSNDIFDYKLNKNKDNDLNLSFWQYIKSFFVNTHNILKKKRKLLEKTKNVIIENLNLSNILNKLIELEKIKYILFDSDQLELFHCIPKPIAAIKYSSNNIQNMKKMENKKSIVWENLFMEHIMNIRKKDGWETYNVISHRENKNEFDGRLLNCFGIFSPKIRKKLSFKEREMILLRNEKNGPLKIFKEKTIIFLRMVFVCFYKKK